MSETAIEDRNRTLEIGRLPVGSIGKRSAGWWGMMTLIATEAALFGYLLFSYYYLASHRGAEWVPELPSFKLSGPDTVILILSSVAVWFGERGAKKNARTQLVAGLAGGVVLGVVFVGIQMKEWMDKSYTPATHSYGSTYFTITGFHMAHVVAGLLVLVVLTVWSALGYFDRERMAPITIGAIYWHFVDVVWLAIFFTIYVSPYLMK
ncbi:cytochrome c oxidase subunit 3 [Consotaella aegiceratis]|uniref:cytochrome c oxidase subunit 3 n=1 Tax=Consotaella aegiceratis TaxID=3097961 RepID=UPI002F423268